MRDTMAYDARLYKPVIDSNGISDPVNVFTTNGMVLVAWWDDNDKCWHDINGETFGAVKYWSNIYFPTGWDYDSKLYGGEE